MRLTLRIEAGRALEIAHCLDWLAQAMQPALFAEPGRTMPLHDSKGAEIGFASFDTPPEDVTLLQDFKGVFSRAADVMAFYRGKDDPDARVLRKLAENIVP